MRIIGLTGGIASGKSTVSAHLQQLGATLVDADALAYALALPDAPLWQAYTAHFGPQVLRSDRSLDRARIGAIVFASIEEKRWIDATAHPLIERAVQERLAGCEAASCPFVVLDVPLLFEAGWDRLANEIWVVYVRPEIQLKRLMERNGYTMEEARQRIAAQMSLEEKRQRADLVIDNNGTPEEMCLQVTAAWQALQKGQEG